MAVVLAVICLPVILLSLDADAQPTVDDDTSSCSASTLQEVTTEIKKDIRDQVEGVKQLIASGSETKNETSPEEAAKDIKDHMDIVLYLLNDEIVDVKDEVKGVKTLLESESRQTNETTLEDVGNMVKIVASNQQQNAKEIRDVKILLGSGSKESNETRFEEVTKKITDEIEDVKTLLVGNVECGKTNDTRLENVIRAEIKDVKTLLDSERTNDTTLEEVVNMVKIIASNQQENARDIRDLKRLLESGSRDSNDTGLEHTVKEMKDELVDVKKLLASVLMGMRNASNPMESCARDTSTLSREYFAFRYMNLVLYKRVYWLV